MNILEVQLELFSRVSLRDVEALGCVSQQVYQARNKLWGCQHWWYLRACDIASSTLQPRPSCNWTNIYLNLRCVLPQLNPFTHAGVMPIPVMEVLLELGHDPTEEDLLVLHKACLCNASDRVKFLLENEQVHKSLTASHYYQMARLVQNESVELVKKQLSM